MSIITRTLLLLSLLAGLPISAYCAMGKMPIIAYCGVPDWKTSDGNFRTFSECGFMVSLYPSYESLDLLVRACRYADKYGVKVIGRCPEMEKSPEAVAGILKGTWFLRLYDTGRTVCPRPSIKRKRDKTIKGY